jgi:hypothetical protein
MDASAFTRYFSLLLALVVSPLAHAGYKPGAGWPEVSTPFYHAPSATQALLRLADWRAQKHVIRGYKDTGSMHPVLQGGREVMAMEPCRPDTPLEPGQMVEFNRGDRPAVLHYIADVSSDGQYLYLSGVGNRYSDGWFHRDTVAYVVREVIVTPDLPSIAVNRQIAVVSPQESAPTEKEKSRPKRR